MRRGSAASMKATLARIARGRTDDLKASTVAEGFFACVRLARIELGVCVHCSTHLTGNRCQDCEKLHPADCCYCRSCSCPCSMEG